MEGLRPRFAELSPLEFGRGTGENTQGVADTVNAPRASGSARSRSLRTLGCRGCS